MKQTILEIFALRRNGYSGPFFQGLLIFCMGMWVLVFEDTFAGSQKYDLMEEFASELAWGVGLIVCSALIIIGALSRKPREVAMGSAVIGAAWFLMFASFIAASPASPMNAIAFVMVLRCVSLFREFWTQFDHVTGRPYGYDSIGERQ